MNDTNNKGLLIAIISVVLVIALIVGIAFGVVNAIGKVSDSVQDSFKDVFGDIETDEPSDENTDTGEVPGTDETPGDSTDTGEAPDDGDDSGETPDANNNPVYSYANGDVKISFSDNVNTGKSIALFMLKEAKPNCIYKISWDVSPSVFDFIESSSVSTDDNNFPAYGHYYYSDDNGDGVDNDSCVKYFGVGIGNESDVLHNSVKLSTNNNPKIGIVFLKFDFLIRDLNSESIEKLRSDIGEYVVSITFEELGEVKTEFIYGVDDPSFVDVDARIDNTADKVCSGIVFYKLKPNTNYTFYWQLDENYVDYGFYIPLAEFNGEQKYYFRYYDTKAASSTSKAITADRLSFLVYNTEGITFTTNDEGFANIMVFYCDKTVYQEYGDQFGSVLRSLIKSFKAVEVK